VRVAEGAHQLALLHELAGRLADHSCLYLGTVYEDVVDFLGGAYGSGYLNFLYAAVGARPESVSRTFGRTNCPSSLRKVSAILPSPKISTTSTILTVM